MTDCGNADRRLVAFHSSEYGKYVDALEAEEGPDRTERKARAFDVVNDALFGYGDVLLKGGRAPQLVINNEEGTEVSITEAAAKALREAGVQEWE